MRCCVCGNYGYLMICESCGQHVCVPCSKHFFEPDKGAYQCHLCHPEQPEIKYNDSVFECSLCFNELTVDAEVSVKECHHETMKACSTCMFKYIYAMRPNCPFCNEKAYHLLHAQTKLVAKVNCRERKGAALHPSLPRAGEHVQTPILMTEMSSTPESNDSYFSRCCSDCNIL